MAQPREREPLTIRSSFWSPSATAIGSGAPTNVRINVQVR
jgi:hypothetical protein